MILSSLVSIASYVSIAAAGKTRSIVLSKTPPASSGAPPLEAFVSFSIEFSSFPDFAGNKTTPNTFSNNLLNNIGNLTGTKPYIRVGGNTQDYALYNASLLTAINGTVDQARSSDYPTTIYIGKSYFDSYSTWPDTKYIHGFNLGLGGNNSAGWETLTATVPLACQALNGGKLLLWEYGNEPDLYSTSSQGPVRPPTWNETTYVSQWLSGTRAIKNVLAKACPNLTTNATYGYYAPSFAGTDNHLKQVLTWQAGLDVDKNIKLISSHNYIGGANSPGVTLQGTLLNHSSTVNSVSSHRAEIQNLSSYNIPYVLGETNSLYNEGKPGLSNAFGAALWGIDFNLWCASQGIRRIHMHMGTNYRYCSWQPVETNITTLGTKAPYYGNIAVAAFLGNLVAGDVSVANIPQPETNEAVYAVYVKQALKRVMVVNMQEYNYTVNGTSDVPNSVIRPTKSYTFSVPSNCGNTISLQRLMANGSDAISGITFDGLSYNYELQRGMPVRLTNVTIGEKVSVKDGTAVVAVPASSAAILNFS